MSKPPSQEDEYFARLDAEKKQKLAETLRSELDAEAKSRLKALHWMHCPKCGLEMQTFVYRGLSLEKCFGCNGVFLDDGELEKLAGTENSVIRSFLQLFKT